MASLYEALLAGNLLDQQDDELSPEMQAALNSGEPMPRVTVPPKLLAPTPEPSATPYYLQKPVVDVAAPAEPVEEAPSSLDVVKQGIAARAAPPRDTFRSMAEKMGLGMEDMLPPAPPIQNSNTLAADLGRAGSTIGAALAGVKPDSSFYDNLERRGATEAATREKPIQDFTQFKRQVMLKAAGDRAKAGKDKLGFEQANALFSQDPNTKDLWAKYVAESKAQGIEPDPDLFAKQAASVRGQFGATGRHESGQDRMDERQRQAHAFRERMNRTEYHQAITKTQLEADLKKISEMNHAEHPFRDFMPNVAPPTVEEAKLVRRNDALAGQLNYLAKKLVREITTNSAIDKKNPLSNKVIKETYQELLNIARDKENFGVPSGRDMEQLANMIADPTSWMEFFTEQGMGSLESLLENNRVRSEIYAQTNRFGPYGVKNGGLAGPVTQTNPVAWPAPEEASPGGPRPSTRDTASSAISRARAAGDTAGSAPPIDTGPAVVEPGAQAPSPAPKLTPPKPGMVRIMDPKTNKRGWAKPGALPPGTVEVNDGR